ncbi:olfactory receptor 51E2-like [Sceloporus undulatus]|uniref:olfactory receptor 51E2-like n=1 Tax=Sceloporus undulatus TaxID=8520 RepID=UPI001C4B4C82|nr:olfactory receptor 51E2-like [Sceloporus undulatus]XP_042312079.1 olfactory receptor 51E2-like [Sceloporus undulatus]
MLPLRSAMTLTNGTCGLRPSSFTLQGLPGLEDAHFWLAFPLCAMYLVAIVGNATILLVVKTEPTLHAPMYLFLCMLAAVDLALATCTMPKILSLFWSDDREIGYEACLLQMFFIHSLSGIESTILLAMAVDRYVAICRPLQYSATLTRSVTAKVGLVAVARGVAFFLPLPLLVDRLPFCGPTVLTHSYCLHQDVMNLACEDTMPNVVYGLVAIFLVMGLDSLLIFLSYVMIIKAVLQLRSREERFRAAGACVAHVCIVLAFYVPLIGLSVVHRFGRELPPMVQITMSNVYLLLPPVLNPIIYGARTKEIRRRALKMVRVRRDPEPH